MEHIRHNPAAITHLLNIYRTYECLWNFKSPDYKRMDLKGEAWEKLAQELECTVDEVKKKIKYLRTTYANEKKKVVRSKQAGSSYEPRLSYFNDISFLDDFIFLRRNIFNAEESDASYRVEEPPAKRQKIVGKRKILKSKATPPEEDDIIEDDFIEDVCEYPKQSYNVADNFGSINMERLAHNPTTIIHIINMYRKCECLWNYKNPNFKRMDVKRKAWEKLARALESTVNEVKKKVKHLRTTYMAEKKKVDISKEAGSSYEPRLFYFKDFWFLDDFITFRRSISNIEENHASYQVEETPAKRQKIVEKRKILESKATSPEEDDTIEDNFIEDDIIEDVCEYPKQSNNVADNFGSVKHNPDTIIHLINIYRTCECLWNYKSPNYKRMDVKKKAWNKIARELKCTVKEVKKKIKHLRAAYVAEKKKVEESKHAGSSYGPRLFYFKDFCFLDDLITFRRSISNIEESDASYQVEEPPAKRQKIVGKRKILESKATPPEEDDIIEYDFIEDVCEYPKQSNNAADNFGPVKHYPATIIRLINIYRTFECLWNYKSPNYKRMDVKMKAWNKIAQKMECTVKEVRKKIQHLRATYVAEKKKVERSKQAGSSYEPRLYYFKNFCFLDDFIIFQRRISNIEESDASYQVEEPPAKRQTIFEKRKILESKETSPEEDGIIEDNFTEDDIIEDVCEYRKQSNNVTDNFESIHTERLTHNQATIIHLINIYRTCECLWNYKSPNYKRMDVKLKAWNKIAQKMEGTVKEVKKKIRHLRATYVAEKKKVERSKQAGSSYEPRLFYFKNFCFLDDFIVFQRRISNIEESDASYQVEEPPAKRQTILEKRKILESKETSPEEDGIIEDNFTEDDIIEDVCEYRKQSNNVTDNFESIHTERLTHNQATIIHLINMYRTCECLWKYNNPNYKRMDQKGKAWDKLARALECTVQEVKKKIKHLRTAYVAEKKKVEESKQAGSSYEPRLFYFKYLSFLDGYIIFRRSISNIEKSDASYQVEEPPAKRQKIVGKRKILESKATPPEDDDIIEDDFIEDNFTEDNYTEDDFIEDDFIEDDIIEENCEHPRANNNVADNLAKVWSAQYAELSDRQKLFVRTIFSDVLFCGCLGRLTENTVEYMQSVLRNNKQLISPMETVLSPKFEECDVSQVSEISQQFLTDDGTNTSYLED